ncbi:MAG: hydantoinase/oxoprolinase family protein [Saccharofermentanales bacterium]|jgi:N-methylhydantoinase A
MSKFRISADIGGTFTDVVFYNIDTQEYHEGKTLTTTDNLSRGIISCIDEIISNYEDIDFFVHGTTSGLNAVLERQGSKVALITTKGFKDVYHIARGNRSDMYDLFFQRNLPLLERQDVFEIEERILADGSELTPINIRELEQIIKQIYEIGYKSIAVCLINSYCNPKHELEIGCYLEERTEISYSLSCDIAPEWREYERTSTTILNAYISPIVENYLSSLEREMHSKGYKGEIFIMQSGGGVISSTKAKKSPILTLLSGPVGGAVGNSILCKTFENKNIIGVDMGGTSYDVSMIVNGDPDVSNETSLEGFPLLVPMINIYTIGAGGGSIAWLEGGGLRVGPISAGANPGPACYGIGGEDATITDANLVLGRIDEEGFLGGKMLLDKNKSLSSIKKLANALNISVMETAEGICRIADSKMADAIRQLTIRKGIDPREFILVSYGGAGSMHACNTAKELGISTVIVPPMPGIYSAWGMLQADIRHDMVRTVKCNVHNIDREEITKLIATMRTQMKRDFEFQNIPSERQEYQVIGDMRYLGQEYTLKIPMMSQIICENEITRIIHLFHDEHQRIYGHHNKQGQVELVNIRLIGKGILDKISPTPKHKKSIFAAKPTKTILSIFDGEKIETPVFLRKDLDYGFTAIGPAIIEELTATTVVIPGYSLYVDKYLNLVLRKEGEK